MVRHQVKLLAGHPESGMVVDFHQPGDEGTHKLTLNFINADGHLIMQGIPPLPVPVTLPDDAHFLTRNFIVNIQQLEVRRAGLYSVDVRLDNESVASVPLLGAPDGGHRLVSTNRLAA
jgi:hypothetical protein